MPHQSYHKDRAAHNAAFYAEIDAVKYADWAIIVLFYKAIHMIECVLAQEDNEHSSDHGDRGILMKERPHLFSESFLDNYDSLEDLSKIARYKPQVKVTNSMVCAAQDYSDVIEKWYNQHIER